MSTRLEAEVAAPAAAAGVRGVAAGRNVLIGACDAWRAEAEEAAEAAGGVEAVATSPLSPGEITIIANCWRDRLP